MKRFTVMDLLAAAGFGYFLGVLVTVAFAIANS